MKWQSLETPFEMKAKVVKAEPIGRLVSRGKVRYYQGWRRRLPFWWARLVSLLRHRRC